MYKGKTIIFLDNKFNFYKPGRRCVCELCDSVLLADIGMAATRFLFLDCSDRQAFSTPAKSAGLPVLRKSDTVLSHRSETQAFNCKATLLESVSQSISLGAAAENISIYTIPIRRSTHRLLQWNSPDSHAEHIKKYLQHHLPQERFLVTTVKTGSTDPDTQFSSAVLHGLQHSIDMIALEPRPSHTQTSNFESYTIASSLPVVDRMDLAWTTLDAQEATRLSLASLSLLLRLNTEIQTFLRENPWPNRIRIPTKSNSTDDSLKDFFHVQFPTLFELVINKSPEQRLHSEVTPEYVKTLLAYAVASSRPQKKRHIAGSVILPTFNRRRQLHQCLLFIAEKSLLDVDMKKFRHDARSLHSLRNKEGKRDTEVVITRLVSEFTQQSTHQFCKGQVSARDILPRTEACTVDEWDRRWRESEAARVRIEAETEVASTVLGKMNLGDHSSGSVEPPS